MLLGCRRSGAYEHRRRGEKVLFRAKAGNSERLKKLFGEGLQEISLSGVTEETGYVTSVMKEKEFAALYEQLADITVGSRIRIEA